MSLDAMTDIAIINRFGTGLEPDRSMEVDDDAPPISSTRHQVIDRPVLTTDNEIRCQGKVRLANGVAKVCNRLLANLATRPWEIRCPRCKAVSRSEGFQPPDVPVDSSTDAPLESSPDQG